MRFKLALVLALAVVVGCPDDSEKRKKPPKPLEPDVYELNNDFGTCASILVNPLFTAAGLTLHNRYDEDYFCFSLSEDSIVYAQIGFDNDDGNLDLQLYDSNFFLIATSASTTQHMELIIETLVADTYYVRVYSPDESTNIYDMEIEAIPNSVPPGPGPFEPNDTPATCTPVVNPVDLLTYSPAATLSIHTPTDEDWFCFNVSAVAEVTARINFFHVVGNLDMRLFDSGVNEILKRDTFTNNEELIAVLPSGDYFLQIYGVGGDLNNYTIQISGTPATGLLPDPYEPNNDPATCGGSPGDLGILTGISAVPVWEHLGLTLDTIFDEDYYCFDLAQDATVQADLTFLHSLGNVDLEILDSTHTVFNFARSYTDDERLLVENLPAGLYSLHVLGGGSGAVSTTYSMAINVFEVDALDAATPNDDAASATALGTMSIGNPGITRTGLTTHDRNDEDYLAFTLDAGNDWDLLIDVLFQHWVGDIDIELYEAPGTGLPIQFSASKTDNEQIDINLPPGDYILRVYGFLGIPGNYGVNRYDLNMLVNPAGSVYPPDRFEVNDSFVDAEPINLDWAPGAPLLNIHNGSDDDYFQFTLQGGQDREVTVDVLYDVIPGDLDVALYADDGSGPRVVARDDGGASNAHLQAILPPGGGYTYYVHVYGWNGATNEYDISISAQNASTGYSPDAWEPNNTFATANPQFLDFNLSGDVVQTGLSIHNSIDEDFISFSVSELRSVTIDLTFAVTCAPVCEDLDLWVYDDQQNIVDYDVSGASNAHVEMNVAPGIEYVIFIYGYQGAMNNYDFALRSAAPIPLGEDGFEPNDVCPGEARLIPAPVALSGLTIDDVSTSDYYKVRLSLPDRLKVKISFTNSLGDLDLELLDDTCALLYESKSTVNSVEEIEENLVPGDYIIRVLAGGLTPNEYRLDVVTSTGVPGLQPDPYEYNNDLMSCTPIPFPWSEQGLTIHNQLDEDFYCFTLTSTDDVLAELLFIHALGDINGTLWCITGGTLGPGPDCPRIIGSATSQTDNEIIWDGSGPFHLSAGEYYIQVQTARNGTNYYDIDVRDHY